MSTMAVRKPVSPLRCTSARLGSGSPSDQPSTSSFGGSISSINGYSVLSFATPVFRSISPTRWISAPVNPSSGWELAGAGMNMKAANTAIDQNADLRASWRVLLLQRTRSVVVILLRDKLQASSVVRRRPLIPQSRMESLRYHADRRSTIAPNQRFLSEGHSIEEVTPEEMQRRYTAMKAGYG